MGRGSTKDGLVRRTLKKVKIENVIVDGRGRGCVDEGVSRLTMRSNLEGLSTCAKLVHLEKKKIK